MIRSSKDPGARDVFDGVDSEAARKLLPRELHENARRKMDLLNSAVSLRSLNLPGLRLEALDGEHEGQHSIRINKRYRICFQWESKVRSRPNVGMVAGPSLTDRKEQSMRRLPTHRRPAHPGEVLLEDFLEPVGLTQKDAAQRLRISYPRMNELVNGKRRVTPETALRFGKLTDTDPAFWLNLQQALDLWDALQTDVADEIELIEPMKVD